MRKFVWLLGCVLLFGLGSRTPAKAQFDAELTKNWDLRAGFFVPERQASRAQEGDLWFTIGVERGFYETDRYKGTISLDYYGSGGVYNIPITVNLRGTTQHFHYGLGAGVGISHDLSRGILGFTYNLGVGYDLTQGKSPITADVRYIYQSTSAFLNGWAFTLGGHF